MYYLIKTLLKLCLLTNFYSTTPIKNVNKTYWNILTTISANKKSSNNNLTIVWQTSRLLFTKSFRKTTVLVIKIKILETVSLAFFQK